MFESISLLSHTLRLYLHLYLHLHLHLHLMNCLNALSGEVEKKLSQINLIKLSDSLNAIELLREEIVNNSLPS